jgi:iron(III) transport system permease protein
MTAIDASAATDRFNSAGQSVARRNLSGPLTRYVLPIAVALVLALGTIFPIGALLIKSVLNPEGAFVGAANFIRYATEPGIAVAAWNSVLLSSCATLLTIAIAYPFSYALTRSHMPLKGIFQAIVMLPLLAPSLLPALGMIYLFGTQGVLKSLLFGGQLYGPIGIVMSSVFYALPTAVLILSSGLSAGDGRLYEAARALKAGPWRAFFAITLPSSRYALVSACSVVFVLVFTDFGVPTVVGGSTNMLATDIYKLVIGRFDFQLGAVVGVLLLVPAIVAYCVDFAARRAQRATLTGKSIPVTPVRSNTRDMVLTIFCSCVCLAVLGVIGMAIFGSLVKFWPYNLTFDPKNYLRILSHEDDGRAILASLQLAFWTATFGAAMVAVSGWLVARRVGHKSPLQVVQGLAMLPVAVPGLVLGLGYIFFFNEPSNPFNFIYASMAILVLCTVVHFYTVPHLMVVETLLRADAEIDMAARALRASPLYVAQRIHLPTVLTTLVDVAGYFFVNAMTTVSALIFLFTANTRVGSIAVVNLLDGSRYGQAAALSVVIMILSLAVTVLQVAVRSAILRKQPWMQK